jgi:hypothetical protein
VDVEGAARNVLSGGTDVLQRASILFMEVEDAALWKQAWRTADVASFLYDAGMLPLARDFESRYQYNMIFVSGVVTGPSRPRTPVRPAPEQRYRSTDRSGPVRLTLHAWPDQALADPEAVGAQPSIT